MIQIPAGCSVVHCLHRKVPSPGKSSLPWGLDEIDESSTPEEIHYSALFAGRASQNAELFTNGGTAKDSKDLARTPSRRSQSLVPLSRSQCPLRSNIGCCITHCTSST